MAELTVQTAYRTTASPIQWGLAARPLSGADVSGDLHVVRPFDRGILVGAVDGIGHGAEAAQASTRAVEILSQEPARELAAHFSAVQQGILGTRGAVMSLCSYRVDLGEMQYGGVGNVSGWFWKVRGNEVLPPEPLFNQHGTVGTDTPGAVVPITRSVARGDVVILCTDGIKPQFEEAIFPRHAPQQIASQILEEFWNGRDDALVLVVRYLGQPMPPFTP